MKITKRVELTGHAASIYAVIAKEGKIYTASGDKFVARWNLQEAKQDNFAIKSESSIYAISVLQDAPILIIATSSGAFHVIDILQKKELHHFVQHTVAIFSIQENFTNNQVYITDADGNLSIWDKINWELILFLPLLVGKIREVLVAEDGKSIFLACQDGTIRSFDTQFFNEKFVFKAHKDGVNCLAFFPEKKNILISGGKDGYLRVWTLNTNACVLEIPAHNFGIYKIEFFNNGKYFCTASRDKSIKIWDTNDCSVISKLERKQGGHSHAVNDICKLDEHTLCSVGDDKRIIIWDVSNES
jgi:WD40 repeat protein